MEVCCFLFLYLGEMFFKSQFLSGSASVAVLGQR